MAKNLLSHGLAASVRRGVLHVEYAGAPWTSAETSETEFVELPLRLPTVGVPQGRVVGANRAEVRVGQDIFRVEPLWSRALRAAGVVR